MVAIGKGKPAKRKSAPVPGAFAPEALTEIPWPNKASQTRFRATHSGARVHATGVSSVGPRKNGSKSNGRLTNGSGSIRGEAEAVERNPDRAAMLAEGIVRGIKAPIEDAARVETRKSFFNENDPHALERVIGTRDILQITFLHQALAAARPVCRLRLRSHTPGELGFGTGFLVAPGVLLTNHHVLDSAETATLSFAEFEAELDPNFVERTNRVFNLLPAKLFVTDPDLDFTFVAVNSLSSDGTPLADFRWLTLLRESGKGLHGEWATIIQHPGGETKQIVVRDNMIVVLPEKVRESIGEAFLHYKSDTEPGSSGSPVFNDQFEVIALHHKAVPEYNHQGRPLALDSNTGKKVPWTPAMGEKARLWLANEGVRISEIFKRLDRLAHRDAHAAKLLSLLEEGAPGSIFSPLAPSPVPSAPHVEEGPALEATVLARRKGKGYDPKFLGFEVPLPKPNKKLEKEVQHLNPNAEPRGGRPGELVYTHFSVLMHAKRRMAIFTAANIDGALRRKPTAKPRWRPEGRINREAQSLNELYVGNELDKGHLVRRLDPVWGKNQQEADDAVIDTYHYTNAAPQEHTFNDGVWGDVEDYILGLAEANRRQITVFTGPIFTSKDIKYRADAPEGPWVIPARFWKVIVYRKSDDTKAATGFVLDQSDEITDITERLTPLPEARKVARVHQREVSDIEKMTDLSFGDLSTFDPLNKLESTKRTRRIVMPAQMVL
jgi:endonuclease G